MQKGRDALTVFKNHDFHTLPPQFATERSTLLNCLSDRHLHIVAPNGSQDRFVVRLVGGRGGLSVGRLKGG
jgi:hypothetical protein